MKHTHMLTASAALFALAINTNADVGYGPDYSNGNYDGVDFSNAALYPTLVGANFENSSLRDAKFTWTGSIRNLTDGNFRNADMRGLTAYSANFTGADFSEASIHGTDDKSSDFDDSTLTIDQLKQTLSFKNKNLSYMYLRLKTMANVDFSGFDFTGSRIGPDLAGSNFTDANIDRVTFEASNLTYEQLSQTANFKAKDLSGVSFEGGYYVGGDYSKVYSYDNFDLRRMNLSNIYLYSVNNFDLRGSNTAGMQDPGQNSSYIGSDGVYVAQAGSSGNKHFENLIIRKDDISVKFAGSYYTNNSALSGMALTLESGALLEIADGSTLFMRESINDEGSKLVLKYGADGFGSITGNIDFEYTEYAAMDGREMPAIEIDFAGNGVSGLEILAGANVLNLDIDSVTLSVFENGMDTTESGAWHLTMQDGKYYLIGTPVPEPAAFAAIAGILAIGLAAYRRRK